ncbi:MAG TPA: hypothetical protein VFP54_12690 [Acidimicrobiales bacterium]|nr:hypothetical protein [Acidimicrobiales bacterium]
MTVPKTAISIIPVIAITDHITVSAAAAIVATIVTMPRYSWPQPLSRCTTE